MRVAIREQLAALVIFAVLVALAVVSIPTWIFVNRFVNEVESSSLSLTASLKAARITSEIDLIQSTAENVASRILIQRAFTSFYRGNHSASNWSSAVEDLQSALSSAGSTDLYQARLYSRNTTGDAKGLLSVTGTDILSIALPYNYPNGSSIMLGDDSYGYPPSLYPNITYTDTGVPSAIDNTTNGFIASPFPNVRLTNNGGLLLGPLIVNSSFALVSVTVPVRRNNNQGFILGYMTFVASATSLIDILASREGLGNTGAVLIVGPATHWNRFNSTSQPSNATYMPKDKAAYGQVEVRFVLPPLVPPSGSDRHSDRAFRSGSYAHTFKLATYPALLDSFATHNLAVNNASTELSTTNEQGYRVAVGFARPQSSIVNWAVAVEQDRREAYSTVATLRKILLGCVFGTAGLVIILVVPCAHLSVKPIRQLKYATEKSIAPPGYADEDEAPSSATRSSRSRLSGKGWVIRLRHWTGLDKKPAPEPFPKREAGDGDGDGDMHTIFKIPGKVPERRHFITDELTELTTTFNAMSDELFKQYESLDEKVAERTRELEISKKAAEAANESKTLFIANISHELKTPLNGIMGMCSICMEEEDVFRIKQSLKTLYKSGDLLLHLLEDLLSFSKNQIGHQVSLDEREFRLGDIRSQVLAIFDKQVREGKLNFSVNFASSDPYDFATATAAGSSDASTLVVDGAIRSLTSAVDRNASDPRLPALGPPGAGRLKDMCLWGDQHRILQVIINLVSNSLKFTPPGGKVDLRIRCIGEVESLNDDSRTSSFSKTVPHRGGRPRNRHGSTSTQSVGSKVGGPGAMPPTTITYVGGVAGTALSINPLDPKTVSNTFIHVRERSPTPPPPGAKSYVFEFEIQDTGPGIPLHLQEKVFEPFVQGDLGLSKRFGGTGLGLSICQQLATLMGGTITLASTVNVGTIFTMRIPLKYVKDRASSTTSSSIKSRSASVSSMDGGDNRRNSYPKSASDVPKSKPKPPRAMDKPACLVSLPIIMPGTLRQTHTAEDQMAAIDEALGNKLAGQARVRVLVADDNSTNIEVVSRMLKLEDIYDVTIAKDGQEAFDLVKATMERNQQFDVIFMDVQMPNLDGLQSTRLIRNLGYSAPIVALTAFSEESNVKECMESGMNEFLSKPIRRPALKKVLQKFATIIEEPETLQSRNGSPNKTPDAKEETSHSFPGMAMESASSAGSRPSTGPETAPDSTTTMVNGTSISSTSTGVLEHAPTLTDGAPPAIRT